ncbi:tRNA guanosine-2'-O-methyltransferase TRM11-like protein [Hordeum vulgare]|nr:tRNA guanosine-2'-O-methyltransferase TRM11-like protein [Hordeum vulgare]
MISGSVFGNSEFLGRVRRCSTRPVFSQRAKDIWNELGLEKDIQRTVAEDRSGSFTMATLMERHATKYTMLLDELIAVGSSYIWWQRRQIVKSTGAVARDDRGEFIVAAGWFIPQVVSVDVVETIAIWNGLYLAAQMGCNSLHIESDRSNAVEDFNTENFLGQEAW